MLLKSIKVKDFRQFKGEQYVSFSTDPERNVTIIQGDNGAGKALCQALSVPFNYFQYPRAYQSIYRDEPSP